MAGSRGMYDVKHERRSGRRRFDENPKAARDRMASKNTRSAYASPMPSQSVVPSPTTTPPRPAMVRPRPVSNTRYVGVVDQWFGSNGFVIVPELGAEILFLHVNDLNCDEKDITVGVTIECMVAESNKMMANGRAPRRMAVDVFVAADPITRTVEAVVVKADDKGNAWLMWENKHAYFRNRTPLVGEGERVTAMLYNAPKGMRATGVQVIA